MTRNRTIFFDGLKAVPIDPDVAGYEWAWNITGPRGDAGALSVRAAYNAVGHLRRSVGLRANAIAEMPRHWYGKGGEEIQEADIPWAGTFSDLLWRLEASLCVSGAGYLWRNMTGKRIASLRWFASSTMTLKQNRVTGAPEFERALGNRRDIYGADTIIYVWQPDPFIELGPAVAPAATALINAGVIHSISQYSAAFFERGAISPTILSLGGNPPKDERERVKSWWRQIATGVRNAFTSEVVTGDFKATTLSSPVKDLAMPELSKQHKEDLATAMGIPYSMLFSDAANFATASQDVKTFYDSTILPQANLIQTALNEQLCNPLGLELYFAADELPAYQDDEAARSGSLAALVSAGMPLDVALEALGYDLGDEAETRIRVDALLKAGMSYDAARAIILAEEEQPFAPAILAVLEALRPAPAAPVAVTSTPPVVASNATETAIPGTQGANTGTATRSALSVDLGKWERKATKALAAGKPAAVTFDSEAIMPALAAAIGGALESATDADSVRRVFRDAIKRDSQAFYAKGDPNAGNQEDSDMRRPLNITVSPVINIPEIKMPDTFRLSDLAPPIVNVASPTVNVAAAEVKMPEQPAPVVNVAAPIVNIAAPEAAEVKAAPVINVNIPRIVSEEQTVIRDRDGNLKGTTTTIKYEGDR